MYTRPTWCTYVLPLQPHRDITFVLICRLINEDIYFIITEHESLHQKKQFDWTLRGHDP